MSSVLENELFIRCDLHPSHAKQRSVANSTQSMELFVTQLLLYDKIYIPTNDFAILPVLLHWVGFDVLKALLQSRAVGFVRPDALHCYMGGGEGLVTYRFSDRTERPFEWWQEAMHTPDIALAADIQLSNVPPKLAYKDRVTLVEHALKSTTEYSYKSSPGCKSYADETYQDVLHCSTLRAEFAKLCGYPRFLPSPNQLLDIDPNSVRVLTPVPFSSPADVVLWAADLNVQVRMAAAVGGADLHGSEKSRDVLKDKLLSAGIPEAKTKGFGRLLDLSRLPGIAQLVVSRKLSLSELLRIRESKEAVEFRSWLTCAEPNDARDLQRLYIQSLSKVPSISSVPSRIFRFALTTAIGLKGPIIGAVAGVIDSFFVESWLGGYRPKLFFDHLRRALPPKRSP
jgi:hypothetical protein